MKTILEIVVILADVFAGCAALFLALTMRQFVEIIGDYAVTTKERPRG